MRRTCGAQQDPELARRNTRPGYFSRDPVIDKSLRHSIKDGVYFSMMAGSAESYFSAFAIFLKATAPQIGLLPPLLASFTQLFSAWLGRRIGRRKPIIVAGAIAQAVFLVPVALAPQLVPGHAVMALIACVFLYYCGPNIGAPQWTSLVGDLLPETRRGRFFALRTRLSSIANLGSLIGAGLLLEVFSRYGITYWGFVAVFGLAAVARVLSVWQLSQMYDPPGHVAALEVPHDLSLWRRIRGSPLTRFSVFFASMQFAVAVAGPFFTLYMLRDLGFSYVEFMVSTVASVLVQFLTLNRWGRLSDLFGNRLILLTTGCIIPALPLLWLVSTHYLWVLCVQAIAGLAWAGFSLSATNVVFDLTPADRRATLVAGHNVLAAIAVFLGASLGGLVATVVPTEIELGRHTFTWVTPLYGIFVLSALLRLGVAVWFLPRLTETRRVRPMSMSGLIFRVTRMHPISGLMYEIVARKSKAGNDADE